MTRTLLEIDQRPPVPETDATGWRFVAERWREPLVADLKRKTLFARDRADDLAAVRALALEVLAHDAPIHWLHLKQYRDAANTDAACYQALVQTTRYVKRLYEIREIEPRVFLRLHQLQDHPIAEVLGLKAMHVVSQGEDVVRVLQPIRPFWLRVGLKEDLGKILRWRTEAGPWQTSPHAGPVLGDGGATHVGLGVLAPLAEANQNIRETAQRWLRETLLGEAVALRDQVVPALPADTVARLRAGLDAARPGHADAQAWALARTILATALDGTGGGSAARYAEIFAAATTEDGYRAMALVAGGLGPDRARLPSERLSFAAARQALDRMEDLQTAIDTLLSEGWENPDLSRSADGDEAECGDEHADCCVAHGGEEEVPAFRIPRDSFAASVDINGGATTPDGLPLVGFGPWYCLDADPPAPPAVDAPDGEDGCPAGC